MVASEQAFQDLKFVELSVATGEQFRYSRALYTRT